MGAACCVAAKSKSVSDEPTVLASRANTRCSPSWNVRWDNRGRVAGEETAVRWFADMSSRDSQLENISETAVRTISEEGSPENFQPIAWSRSPLPGGVSVQDFRSPNSDASISRSISMEGKEAIDYPAVMDRSPMIPSISPLSTSPLSAGGHLFHASSTPARLIRHIPGNQFYMQASDGRIPSFKSPGTYGEKPSPMRSGWANDSARRSLGGSSDSWSIPEYMASTHRERWSFDSDSIGFINRDTIIARPSSHHSPSPSSHLKSCGICSKLLSEKSSFGSQKLIATNELAVVAVLVCGHAYHAECLEGMTVEVGKYDPACPVCTFGEQQALKLSDKAIKAEMESRFKNSKRSKNRVVDSGFQSSFAESNRGQLVGKGGLKIDQRRSFLKRHFSLGSSSSSSSSSKSKKFFSESQSSKKKTLFWTRSSK